MNAKYILYFVVMLTVIYAMDAINLNGFFKKNKIFQARLLYFLFALSLSYLVTNFFWDFFSVSKIFLN